MSLKRSASPSERMSQNEILSPKQSEAIIPAIVEVTPPFENDQDLVSIQIQRSRRRSSIFEEIVIPNPSVCRWLLDIISEDGHMDKESANFILYESQLIRVIEYIFQIVESQVSLNIEDEGCCGKFMHDGTRTLNEITTNIVNIFTIDIDKINLLRDSHKICLLEQIQYINNQIINVNNAPTPDVQTRHKAYEIFDTKADKSETYTKTETGTLLDAKADKNDSYTKTETDNLLDDKADKTDSYTKTETDTLLDAKSNKTELIDSYTKTETDS
ncbi:MAG: hypothetical protein EZS28_025839, partial [Streblomastix strix]